MKYFIVWLGNKTDCRDDQPIKIRAKDEKHVREILESQNFVQSRFYVKYIYTTREFKKMHAWWHAHFWGRKAENED